MTGADQLGGNSGFANLKRPARTAASRLPGVSCRSDPKNVVRKSKAAGYDFIKITTFIKAEVYEAAIDEAAKQNIRVVGHADSRFVGVERALKARQQIEHLDGYLEMLLKADAPMKGSISDLYIYNPKNWPACTGCRASTVNDGDLCVLNSL